MFRNPLPGDPRIAHRHEDYEMATLRGFKRKRRAGARLFSVLVMLRWL